MAYSEQRVIEKRHWSDNIFSFKTTRPQDFTFRNGEFVTLGLRNDNKLIPRAYSIVSSNQDEALEFLSIHVPDGPLTSLLTHVDEGSPIWINHKSTGSLTLEHIEPGRHLYLLATGTGVAPFISLIRGAEVYQHFDKVILVHTVRFLDGLAFRDELEARQDDGFIYFPTVTREAFEHNERGADLFCSGRLSGLVGLPEIDPDQDRVMICGNPNMNRDVRACLEQRGWRMTNHKGVGNFSLEQAFVL